MEFESDQAAAEALAASVSADYAATQAGEQAPAAPATPVEPGTTVEADSIGGFDQSVLSTLPAEARAIFDAQQKSMQADYTRKTQEVSELRKQFGDLDPELASQAVKYVTSLSDPEFFAQAYEAMHEEATRLGLTPAEANQAAQAATEQLATQMNEEFEDLPPHVVNQLNELRSQNEKFEQRFAQMDARDEQTYLMNEALKQETAIRQAHPEYTDNDLAYIIKLSWNTNANLLAANQVYEEIRGHMAKSLLASKASVPSAISPAPNTGGAAEEVPHFKTLDEADKAARERLRWIEANN